MPFVKVEDATSDAAVTLMAPVMERFPAMVEVPAPPTSRSPVVVELPETVKSPRMVDEAFAINPPPSSTVKIVVEAWLTMERRERPVAVVTSSQRVRSEEGEVVPNPMEPRSDSLPREEAPKLNFGEVVTPTPKMKLAMESWSSAVALGRSASWPRARLLFPVVTFRPAYEPRKVLRPPVVLASPTEVPRKLLLEPEVLTRPAEEPRKLLLEPEVLARPALVPKKLLKELVLTRPAR